MTATSLVAFTRNDPTYKCNCDQVFSPTHNPQFWWTESHFSTGNNKIYKQRVSLSMHTASR